MSEIMQFVEATFKPLVLVFVVANMFTLGLQAKMGDVVDTFKNKKAMALIFVWGFVFGPALAYLITLVFPLAEPYVLAMLISSVAPMAPFFPISVEKARGDMSFANAFVPVVIVGTVVLLPLIGPLVIEGLTVSPLVLALRLFLTLLLPKAIGMAIRHYAGTVATKIFPAARGFALLTTLGMIVSCVALYGPEMLATAGSFALLSMTIFMVGMGLITYRFGFGLKQNQRSVMALGMLTRNFAAVLAAALTVPNLDPLILTMIVMWVLWSIVLSAVAARIFGKQAGETVAGNTI